jgi:hypothetical protein
MIVDYHVGDGSMVNEFSMSDRAAGECSVGIKGCIGNTGWRTNSWKKGRTDVMQTVDSRDGDMGRSVEKMLMLRRK